MKKIIMLTFLSCMFIFSLIFCGQKMAELKVGKGELQLERIAIAEVVEPIAEKDKRAVAKEFYRVWLDLEKKMGSELEKLADDERAEKLTNMSTEIVTRKLGISTPVLHKILEQFPMEEIVKEIQSEEGVPSTE